MKKTISQSIDYALHTNQLEGLILSDDDKALLERVRKGEIKLEEYAEAVVLKYKAIASGKKLTAQETLPKAGRHG